MLNYELHVYLLYEHNLIIVLIESLLAQMYNDHDVKVLVAMIGF